MAGLLVYSALGAAALIAYARLRGRRPSFPQLPKPVSNVTITTYGSEQLTLLLSQSGGSWLWGHERLAWETPDSGFYRRNHEKNGKIFVMDAAFFVSGISVSFAAFA